MVIVTVRAKHARNIVAGGSAGGRSSGLRIQKWLSAALFVVLTLLPSAAPAADKLSLILDWYVNPNHGPIIVADRLGYFRQAGLDVEIIAPADSATPTRLVAAGKADLAVSYQSQLHLQVHEGMPLLRVGTLIGSPLNCLMVRDDGSVPSISGLKGRKIGYSLPGVDEMLITTMLSRHGLKMADVELVNVNFALAPALMSKQVDAVIGAYRNVELHQMRVHGVPGRCFRVEAEGVPLYDELIYVANATSLNRDKIARFLTATARAAHYIAQNPDNGFEVFSSYDPVLKDALNAHIWKDTLRWFSLEPAALDKERYQRYEAYLMQNRLVGSQLPVNQLAIDVNEAGNAP